MTRVNYSKELNKLLCSIKDLNNKPSLLLHCCCAPCSSYVLEYLTPYFDITALFYNPNIFPESEYNLRLQELKRLINQMNFSSSVDLIEEKYEPNKFLEISAGLESDPEGSIRCLNCYYLRLLKTATLAKSNNFDFFTTTLTISLYKNADKLNEIGGKLAQEFGVRYLFSDFKKKEGYKRSLELSQKYNLYRQNYCGCKFSKK